MLCNRPFLTLLLASGLLLSQVKRTEITNAVNAAADSKPLTPGMADSVAVEAPITKTLTIRFRHQADILLGLQKHVAEHKIRNAVILTGIGSAMATHYHVVSNRGFPSKNVFLDNPTDSADITNINGYVMNGKIHAHIQFANEHHAFGGHLEKGTKVFTFAIVTLGILPDSTDMARFDDKTWR
jgi:predicted DNA-binding protein with PD1-like motif